MTIVASVPLRVGTDRVAETIRLALDRTGFTEHTVCERLSIPTLEGVGMPLFKSLAPRIVGAGALEALARLFLFGELISPETLAAHLTPEEVEAFFEADLIRRWDDSGADNRLYSPVRFVPLSLPHRASDLYLVGDRGDHPDGSAFTPFSDIVFPGQNPLTRHFLRLLPSSPCRSALDLCAGTAVAALAMAGIAEHCAAGDIAERSVHFARFNSWLNQCDLELFCGDLYEPVAGRRFDRIVAHPPYVPALKHQLTYRDGGQTGDEIVQRVIEGLPQHVSEGGTFHLLCLAMDTGDGLFEERVRKWLGEAEREFDIIFALDSKTPPELIAGRLVDRAGGSQQDLEQYRDLFQGLRVKQFVYGALTGRRFAADRPGEAFTRRVLLTDDCTGEGFAALFAWFDWLRQPDRDARVLALKPRLPPDLHLEVRHRVENNSFVPSEYALTNGGRPFFARLNTEAWVAAMLSEFDGAHTVREVFESAVVRARVPSGFGEADVARMIAFLIERGCIHVDGPSAVGSGSVPAAVVES